MVLGHLLARYYYEAKHDFFKAPFEDFEYAFDDQTAFFQNGRRDPGTKSRGASSVGV